MKKNNNSNTIRDVARHAGVSVATVSRFINRSAPLSSDTAARVQQAMNELNFSPHPAARSLATSRTSNIGFVINDMGGDFFTPLLEGVISTTEAHHYNLLIYTSKGSRHPDTRLLGPMYTDGLLVFLDSLDEQDLVALHHAQHPVVLIHRSSPAGIIIPMVTIENKAAAKGVVSHLIETHHRKRIALLNGPAGNEDAYWREVGYRQALETHGIPVDESLIAPGNFDRFAAQESVRALLNSGVAFDGIFTGDDDAAIGALAALKDAGIRVPEQVSVVGFDNQRLAPFLTPPLTTVHAPTDRVGETAARQLLRLIQHEPVEPEILLPTQLILRSSCGCNG